MLIKEDRSDEDRRKNAPKKRNRPPRKVTADVRVPRCCLLVAKSGQREKSKKRYLVGMLFVGISNTTQRLMGDGGVCQHFIVGGE